MNDTQFIEKYCHNCGTQRCEGPGTEWFEGCLYRWNHDDYDPAAEIKKLNEKVMELASKLIKATDERDMAPIVHGEWVDIISCEDIIYATCNHCHSRGKVRTNRSEWGIWYIDSPYCPKCGAKMDGGLK